MIFLNWASDLAPGYPETAVAAAEQRWLDLQQRFTGDPETAWRELREGSEATRAALARLLHAEDPGRIIFSTGTLGAFRLLTQAFGLDRDQSLLFPGDEVVVSDAEFPILYDFLHGRYRIRIAPVRDTTSDGEVVAAFRWAVSPETRLVFFSHVLSHDGRVLPVRGIADAVRTVVPRASIVVDGSQAVGQIRVDAEVADFYLGDTHKWLQGPNNVGFFYVHHARHMEALLRLTFNPLATASEWCRESRSCSKSGVLGFAVAAAAPAVTGALETGDVLDAGNRRLSGLFLELLGERAPEMAGAVVSPRFEEARSGMVALDLGPLATRRVYAELCTRDIACTLREPVVPEGLPAPVEDRTLLRFAFSDRWNTEEEVRHLVDVLEQLEAHLPALREPSGPHEAVPFGLLA